MRITKFVEYLHNIRTALSVIEAEYGFIEIIKTTPMHFRLRNVTRRDKSLILSSTSFKPKLRVILPERFNFDVF